MDHRGRGRAVTSCTDLGAPIEDPVLDDREHQDHDQQDHRHRLRVADLEEPERGHVDVGGDRLGGVRRTAVGHDPHHVEDPQRPERRQQHERERLRPQQRPGDAPELLEPAGTFEDGVLVVLARERLDRREVDDHVEAGEPPQEGDHDRPQRRVGVRERRDRQRVEPEGRPDRRRRPRSTARTGTSRPRRPPPGRGRTARRTRTRKNVRPRFTSATRTARNSPSPVWSTTATPVNRTVFSRLRWNTASPRIARA